MIIFRAVFVFQITILPIILTETNNALFHSHTKKRRLFYLNIIGMDSWISREDEQILVCTEDSLTSRNEEIEASIPDSRQPSA